MTNVWEFLLWTLTLTVVALLLLLLKEIFRDKLSPRWQYGIWLLLALRALVPVGSTNRYILVDLPLWIQTLKISVEKSLASVYSDRFSDLGSPWLLPQISGSPVSITDWLFVVYAAGVIVIMAWYLVSYVRLRLLLRQGLPAGPEVEAIVKGVCERYNLKACRVVLVDGISSAFVCGVVRPVLALPASGGAGSRDEKILLHELLHLRYLDSLASIGWSCLRALNWCNPVMQYIASRIGNDMEALCDQRVLERLEGEERREYGHILLAMTNEKYARAFGTTSLSNGGKNIARRIDCITRFKKYPRGMRLVSLCIAALLVQPIFLGMPAEGTTAHGNTDGDYMFSIFSGPPGNLNHAKIQNLQCTTLAGAIDTYAKGIILRDGYYLAVAAPKDKQEELLKLMEEHDSNDVDNGVTGTFAPVTTMFNYARGAYYVCNLYEDGGAYYGDLVLPMSDAEVDGEYYSSSEVSLAACAIQPVKAYREDSGRWVTEAQEDLRVVPYTDISYASFYMTSVLESEPVVIYRGETEQGQLEVQWANVYLVDNETSGSTDWMGSSYAQFDARLKVDAFFSQVNVEGFVEYTSKLSEEERSKPRFVTLETAVWNTPEDEGKGWEEPESFPDEDPNQRFFQYSVGSSTNGTAYVTEGCNDPDRESYSGPWSGTITDTNVGSTYWRSGFRPFYAGADEIMEGINGQDGLLEESPYAIACKLYFDGKPIDEIVAFPERGNQ